MLRPLTAVSITAGKFGECIIKSKFTRSELHSISVGYSHLWVPTTTTKERHQTGLKTCKRSCLCETKDSLSDLIIMPFMYAFLTDLSSTTPRDNNFSEHAFFVSRSQTTLTCTSRSKSVSCWCEFCTAKEPFRSLPLPQWGSKATCLWLYYCYYCLSFSWMPWSHKTAVKATEAAMVVDRKVARLIFNT